MSHYHGDYDGHYECRCLSGEISHRWYWYTYQVKRFFRQLVRRG